jgi:hypothetical protein
MVQGMATLKRRNGGRENNEVKDKGPSQSLDGAYYILAQPFEHSKARFQLE